ncbi:hypothetical protein BpHYR1_002371 [Brachionus plicatilis]|uniref:Uncharacterized protein n=1 Tax=Brachionus plicatilis TaxID=10195 RepID=A0A3M7Q9E1_BRAPC|nr:hypothetical protein BpHYR1_002371 [Brachionus plicatilis]
MYETIKKDFYNFIKVVRRFTGLEYKKLSVYRWLDVIEKDKTFKKKKGSGGPAKIATKLMVTKLIAYFNHKSGQHVYLGELFWPDLASVAITFSAILFPRIEKRQFFGASKIILFPRIENNTHIYHPNIYSAIEALKTQENQIAFAYHGKIPVPYRCKLVVYTDASYTFRRQMLILGKLTVDEYIGMILATMSEEEKRPRNVLPILAI